MPLVVHIPLITAVAEVPIALDLPHLDVIRETIRPEVEPLLYALDVLPRERVEAITLAIE